MIVRRIDFVAGDIHCDPDRADGVLARLDADTGFLKLDARLTTVGVFTYSDAEGKVWGELRTHAEVFSADSLASFQLATVTNDHPDRFVDLDNVRAVQVGTIGSDVRRELDFVRASIVVTDANTILAIQRGKCQLSCGYTAEVVAQIGVANGDKFDGVQTNIRGNHVAIVTKGRAGPGCSLIARGDAAFSEVHFMKTAKQRADELLAKLAKNDQASEQAQAVMELLAAAMKTKNEMLIESALVTAATMLGEAPAVTPEVTEPEPEPAAEPMEAAVPMEAAAAAPVAQPSAFDSSTALRAKVDTLEAARKQDADSFSQRVSARVSLVRTALAVLPELVTDGMADDAIRRAVVLAVTPGVEAKLDAHKSSAGYLRAMFDTAAELHAGRADHADELTRAAFDAHNGAGGDVDLDQLHADYMDRQNGWASKPGKASN